STEVEVSLDLGVTTRRIRLASQPWNRKQLETISQDEESVYFVNDKGIFKAELSDKHFYKLMPVVKNQAPALVIDDILMHRVKGTTPMHDASMKAELCARKGIDMLEICTGLGYASIACLEKGVRSIVTIEKDEKVLELARLNPWSRRIFTDDRIIVINADASQEIEKIDDKSFHAVMHDPPRFSMAPELYATEFYSHLYRVLRRNGILLLYVGSPESKHWKVDLQEGIVKRLLDAGFSTVTRKEDIQSVLAFKS
ncbi:MAG: SAM-dependent methyltransferase, partial [Candidatus Thorarchaeota archaeon]